MITRVTTPPTWEPLSVAEAQEQCRIDVQTDAQLVAAYVTAAREWCQAYDNRAYAEQTLECWIDEWPEDGVMVLPRPPLQSVTAITYYDTDDTVYTLDEATYLVDTVSEPGRVLLRDSAAWPSTILRSRLAICVEYVAGWATPETVPERIKQAMRLLVGHWYENRENSTLGAVSRGIEFGAQALLNAGRVRRNW